jgi:hypothetical protein
MKRVPLMWRPRAPDDLVSMEGMMADRFVPDPAVEEWLRFMYVNEPGDIGKPTPLHNPDHAHLRQARLGVLWTNCENRRRARRIVGQAEMPSRSGGGTVGVWQRARMHQQLGEWFGCTPDFLITLDAVACSSLEDASFCALIDHELYHCAQQLDEFGQPKFDKVTGKPLWSLKGHDVEEFVGVVRRFGIEAAGRAATDLVIAAAGKPEVGPARVAQACGTCLRVAA